MPHGSDRAVEISPDFLVFVLIAENAEARRRKVFIGIFDYLILRHFDRSWKSRAS